jgi:hypothetical protein
MNRLKLFVLMGIGFLISCTPYVITKPLETSIESSKSCTVGNIVDELPVDMDIEKKPTLEEIEILKTELDFQLSRQEILTIIGNDDKVDYEITGSVIEFKRGSGVARFFIGFGIGNAKLTVALRLLDRADSSNTIFAGNFSAEVSDWTTKGDEIFKTTAKNFAKALKKEIKRIAKERKTNN